MRTARKVVESSGVEIRAVECSDEQSGWSPPEPVSAARIVLVRRGRFRLDCDGRRVTVEPAGGYLHRPGEVVRFAHPAGGDLCTSVTVAGGVLTDGLEAARSPSVRVDARLELAHRMLLRTGADPDFGAVEAVLELLRLALRSEPDDLPAPGRAELAHRAQELILDQESSGTGLVELARLLESSPSHLSRTFRHHVGMSLSRYRNRVRISRALLRIDQGETDLAALAAALGFSDQAHFTRVMHRELGRTPGRVRALLGPAPAGDGSGRD
ncbi:helix-turn-helix domain-containing protein [Streptacidiphilus griseoplanus]|uniref:helix-turn-helix domain-containing protein n=1 Tax=Peterkaempfera griseoplana TaxID=66896 RepID=UPI001FE035DC|nr:AraC family transcriptional regulator [Peterkaempfera griseoplana]